MTCRSNHLGLKLLAEADGKSGAALVHAGQRDGMQDGSGESGVLLWARGPTVQTGTSDGFQQLAGDRAEDEFLGPRRPWVPRIQRPAPSSSRYRNDSGTIRGGRRRRTRRPWVADIVRQAIEHEARVAIHAERVV